MIMDEGDLCPARRASKWKKGTQNPDDTEKEISITRVLASCVHAFQRVYLAHHHIRPTCHRAGYLTVVVERSPKN